jgi:hypothetical protein
MDINTIMSSIRQKLLASPNAADKHHYTEIDVIGKTAPSASEMLGETGLYLLRLKTLDPRAFNLLESDIHTYINFCRAKYRMFEGSEFL